MSHVRPFFPCFLEIVLRPLSRVKTRNAIRLILDKLLIFCHNWQSIVLLRVLQVLTHQVFALTHYQLGSLIQVRSGKLIVEHNLVIEIYYRSLTLGGVKPLLMGI